MRGGKGKGKEFDDVFSRSLPSSIVRQPYSGRYITKLLISNMKPPPDLVSHLAAFSRRLLEAQGTEEFNAVVKASNFVVTKELLQVHDTCSIIEPSEQNNYGAVHTLAGGCATQSYAKFFGGVSGGAPLATHDMQEWVKCRERQQPRAVWAPRVPLVMTSPSACTPSAHGFVEAIITAWCTHLPLILKPDHLWVLILQGIARHVATESEVLRNRIVSHEGIAELKVEYEPTGDDAADYAGNIEVVVRRLMAEKVTETAKHAFTTAYSTSTRTDSLVAMLVAMDGGKHFFRYRFIPKCGFPVITLLGTSKIGGTSV